MRIKQAIPNKDTFLEAIKVIKENKKKCLGERLYFYKDKSGNQSFLFRARVNGKDKWMLLGNYPEVSYEKARGDATSLMKEVAGARQEQAHASFYAELKKQRQSSKKRIGACFASLEDARKFIDKLIFLHRGNRTDSIESEILHYILLSLMNPTHVSELFDAQWYPLRTLSASWVTFPERKTPRKDAFEQALDAILSPAEFIAHYHPVAPDVINGTTHNAYFFPKLQEMGSNMREAKIAQLIQENWPDTQISTWKFKYFFKEILLSQRSLPTTKVNQILKNSSLTKWSGYSYFELKALYEWWADEIARGKHAFKPKLGPDEMRVSTAPVSNKFPKQSRIIQPQP